MMDQLENMKTMLSDAGLGHEAIARAEKLMEAGMKDDLIRHMRLCRCQLMEDLHETQKRVDRMDHLIRNTEKTFSK
jgi:hypothetical protein